MKFKQRDSHIWKEMGPFINSGWQLAITVCLGCYLGWLADNHFVTSPLWTVVGSLSGAALGLYIFIRAVLNLNKKK